MMTGLQTVGSTLLLVFAGGACGGKGITKVRMPTRANPTSWTFNRSLAAISKCLETGLAADVWGGSAVHPYEPVQMSDKGLEVTLSSNGYGKDSVHSQTYFRDSCPLGVYGKWRVTATTLAPERTRVQVAPLSVHVHNYDCFYIGHPWNCATPVQPSTIEEYRMLVSLGGCLDARDMPAVIQPSGPLPDPSRCE
jgi:hypothetical protein